MKYMFNTDPEFLKLSVTESVFIEHIQNHYDHLALSHFPVKSLKVLIDCSAVRFRVQRAEIESVKPAFEKAMLKYDHVQEAIVVDEKYTEVIAMLFEQYFPDHSHYLFKIFNTEEDAKDWLLNF